jgi:hypothetical protein
MPAKNTSRNHRNNPYAFEGLSGRVQRTAVGRITAALWRWRTELALVASAAAGYAWLPVNALIAIGAVLAVAVALPWSRRWLAARIWCLVTRHRLQRLCFETRMHTRAGRLPLILHVRPVKVGERAWILCRAGICVEDFEAHTGEIRAACYARDARVSRSTRWSQLVTVDIIRRDPLGTGGRVPSQLRGHIGPHVPRQRDPA